MEKGKKFAERKFLLEKRTVKLEDFKAYIEEYHPEDKAWFYKLCCNEQPLKDKDGIETGENGLLPFLAIKKAFYEKYFPEEDTLSKRMKIFSDWEIPEQK